MRWACCWCGRQLASVTRCGDLHMWLSQHSLPRRSNIPGSSLTCWELGLPSAVSPPFMARQRMANIFVTNVPGPPAPLYVLGARIDEVLPFIGPGGNVTLMFAALSYCERLNVLVTANAAACPDLDTLIAGMRRSWEDVMARTDARAVTALSGTSGDRSTAL